MKIKMLTGLSGPDYCLSPGDEPDFFDEPEAGRLVDAGYAVRVDDAKVERAVKKPAAERRG